jgi:hypothetical protein
MLLTLAPHRLPSLLSAGLWSGPADMAEYSADPFILVKTFLFVVSQTKLPIVVSSGCPDSAVFVQNKAMIFFARNRFGFYPYIGRCLYVYMQVKAAAFCLCSIILGS